MEAHRKRPDCPVEMTLQLIGDKWKVLIIRDLMSGTKRFNELMRSVTGITQKVLTLSLIHIYYILFFYKNQATVPSLPSCWLPPI